MNEGQKKRKIGTGMKPRGNKRVKPQKEKNPMTEQSTVEGHETPSQEPVLEGREGNETPGNLEPEKGEKPLQNLENSEAMVAQDSSLEAAMKESSGEILDAEFSDVDEPASEEWPTHCVHGTAIKEPCEKCKAAGGGKDGKLIAEADVDDSLELEPQPPLDGKAFPAVGLQPDGSTKVIVTIQEGYWEAVQQWAEADGVPVERWLSDRLYEYVSTYGEPAKGR